MFEEAAIARKESLSAPAKSENILVGDRRGSTSPKTSMVGFMFRKLN
jgi:hypothetical protein